MRICEKSYKEKKSPFEKNDFLANLEKNPTYKFCTEASARRPIIGIYVHSFYTVLDPCHILILFSQGVITRVCFRPISDVQNQ